MYCCAVHSTVLCVMWYLLTRTYSNTVHIGAVLMYFVLLTVLYVRTVKTKCWLSPKQFSVQAESQTRTKNTLVRVLLSAWTETSPTEELLSPTHVQLYVHVESQSTKIL